MKNKIIKDAIEKGRTALNESESKLFLSAYDLPFPVEKTVSSAEEAAAASDEIGYPVAVKGFGSRLLHKSEAGAVALDLRSKAEVEKACAEIYGRAGDMVEGFIVAQFVKAEREFVCGMARDAQFGPAVMFGLGGIFTEALKDVSFRIAPIDKNMALQMMNEIKGKKLLGAIRGLAPADVDAIADILIKLGGIGLEFPSVSEIDLNPVRVTKEGKAVVVDALVTLRNV